MTTQEMVDYWASCKIEYSGFPKNKWIEATKENLESLFSNRKWESNYRLVILAYGVVHGDVQDAKLGSTINPTVVVDNDVLDASYFMLIEMPY